MKKLFVLLAAVGIFASCSKEAPVLPAADKVQGATSAHSGNKADRITIGMDMSGVLEEFEQVIGSLDAPQEARSISTPINTAAKGTRLIDYKPEFAETEGVASAPGAPKEKMLHALGIIYDKKTGTTVDVIMGFKPNGNNGMIFKGKVEALSSGPSSQLAWAALENSKMKDAYISIYIGVDGTGGQLEPKFTNKGAYLIKNGDDGNKLPKNFVVLKSLDNKLDWDEGSEYPVIIKDRKIAKFSLQGYLLGIRFRNAFPKQMVKHTWQAQRAPIRPATPYKLLDRPDLQLKLRVQGLSVTTSSDIHYDPAKGAVVVTKSSAPTTGFVSYKDGYSAVTPRTLNPQGEPAPLASDVISVPADPSRDKSSLSANEEFILLYCPIPLDQGKIAFEAVDNLFYDGSEFSMYKANASAPNRYYSLNKIDNVITKVKGQGTAGSAARRAMPTDNKIFLQMFDIDPGAGDASTSSFASRARAYTDYSQRLRQLFPGEGYRP